MQYEHITPEQQLTGLKNRVGQLEEEHYTNSVFIFECEVIGDFITREELDKKNVGIEKRVKALNNKIAELSKGLPEKSEDDNSV